MSVEQSKDFIEFTTFEKMAILIFKDIFDRTLKFLDISRSYFLS